MKERNILQSVEQICSYYENIKGQISIEDIGALASQVLLSSVHILDKTDALVGFTTKQNETCRLNDAQCAQKVAKALLKEDLSIKVATDGICPYNQGKCSFEKRVHVALPLVYGSKRIGTLVCSRDGQECEPDYIAVCKILAMLCSMALYNKSAEDDAVIKRKGDAAVRAVQSLSYSERQALNALIATLPMVEAPEITQGFINASTISQQYGITRSVIASALKKLEGAGILKIRSLGMKGTHLTVLNSFIYDVDNLD